MRALIFAAIFGTAWEQQLYRPSEAAEIIERIIQRESKGNAEAVNSAEGSTGLMQMTKIAVKEVNTWAQTNFSMADMKDPEKSRWAGSYLFTNILLRWRCGGNIVQAVAAYNVGISNVAEGVYPHDYLSEVIPWYWSSYRSGYFVSASWRDKGSGAWLVELSDRAGKPPSLGCHK